MALTWQDAEDIALALAERFPETDPLTVRFTDLHRWVTELPGFVDDVKASTEGKLEAIQMAWLEEYRATRDGAGEAEAELPGDD
jgi:FeS assembly protein IscX